MRIILVLLVLTTFHLRAQSKLNKPAGELQFSKILNSEKSTAKLSDFKSKVIILEFWGTWCAPCIQQLPHLEELQNKFKTDIKILTVTDESEERITKFLNKRKLSLPVVLDQERTLSKTFPYRSVPHTVVIDQNGIIKAITTPDKITEEILKRVIAGDAINIPEKIDQVDFDMSKPLISVNENFTYQVVVTPFQNGLPSMSNPIGTGEYKGRRILCTNLSPKSLYEIAYQFPVGIRTVVEVNDKTNFSWSEQNAICFDLIVPSDLGEKRFEIMRQHLAYLYNFKPVVERRKRTCKVLKTLDGQTIKLKPSSGGKKEVSYGGSGLSMKNAEVKTICEFLEAELNVAVVDDTGLSGIYDLELPWYNENPDQVHEELKKIGLTLMDDSREIDVLVISDK